MAVEVRCLRKQVSKPKIRRRARSKVRCCEKTGCQPSSSRSKLCSRFMRPPEGQCTEPLTPKALQRIKEDELARAPCSPGAIHAAATLGQAGRDPVGGAIASSVIAGWIPQRF